MQAEEAFCRLPVFFLENRGQLPGEVVFTLASSGKTLCFTRTGVTLSLTHGARQWTVNLDFVDSDPDVKPTGTGRLKTVVSYLKGRPQDWIAGLSTYRGIVYRNLWPGIDLVFKADQHKVKYEFRVRPGVDPSRIRLAYRGATAVRVTSSGGLRVETPAGSFEDARPLAYQTTPEGRVLDVEMAYDLDPEPENGTTSLGFRLGRYDASLPLVLDPVVVLYCGFLGGDKSEQATAIAVDSQGNTYITGYSGSTESTFPVATGPDLTYNLSTDAFIAKLNPSGDTLLYLGYIGGMDHDAGNGVAVDSSGCAYICGDTSSDESTFPVTVGPDLSYCPGVVDAFVAKVTPSGTGLEYCGYIGGSGYDYARGIGVDPSGRASVAGFTTSTQATFPVSVGPDLTHGGAYDAFIARVNIAGTALEYCGYIGGSGDDMAGDVAVDPGGCAYVAGYTDSTQASFPVAVGPDLTYGGSGVYYGDGFVAKVTATGQGLAYCGYIGGNEGDEACGIAVDGTGSAYVVGWTWSSEASFPVAVGPDVTYNGGEDAFVAKVSPSGASFTYLGYIGGGGQGCARDVAVDAFGFAYVVGDTNTGESTFPVLHGPDLTMNDGSRDAFVARVDADGTGLTYSGYVGGDGYDYGLGIAVSGSGNAYVAGWTDSGESTFPIKTGPDLTHNGNEDAFVAKISFALITGTVAPQPGSPLTFTLSASDDAGLSYQAGTSLGAGPISLSGRTLHLTPDGLLALSISNGLPGVFHDYTGSLDGTGRAQATLFLPPEPGLVGLPLHTAFVTLDLGVPSGVKSVSNTYSIILTSP